MKLNSQQRQVIKRCQASTTWFLANFGKIKHQSAGIIPFTPFSYQREAIKAFRKNRFNIFKKCFAAGSMVWTPFGPRPIETIKIGDLVYAYNENIGVIEIKPVLNHWDNGESETLVIRTKTGHKSICTKDHQFLTIDGWKKANDLSLNDILIETYDNPHYQIANHTDAILLGYMITDGCYSNPKRECHFTNTSWKYLLEFQKHYELKFNKRLRIKIHIKAGQGKARKTCYRITIRDEEFRLWLNELGILGQKAKTKQIPNIVFTWNNRYITTLLNRIFAGDGWYSGGDHCNEVGIGSESVLLLHQIKQLLSRFQIDSKFYDKTSRQSIAKLRIFGTDSFYRFVDQIGIYGKKQRLIPTTKGFFRNRIKGCIKSINPGPISRIYDFEVEDHHNYIIDGVVAHNCRQIGASKIAGAFAFWFSAFYNNKKILIVSRKDEDAMSFLRDQIIFILDNLPEWMQELFKPIKQNEHEIIFPNGSHIQSLTSHPDVMRSHTSSLNIIDESAFIPNMDVMWAAGWPTLQHGGSAICISTCVHPNTYIITENGLEQIKNLDPLQYDGFEDGYYHVNCNVKLLTASGNISQTTKFYKRNPETTKIIRTINGYELEASTRHRINTLNGYKYVSELSIDDYLPILRGFNKYGNNDYLGYEDKGSIHHPNQSFKVDYINEELAYLIGLYTAEGNISNTYVEITNGDKEIGDKLLNNNLGLKWFNNSRPMHYRCCNTYFVRFLKWFGIERCRAWEKRIPYRLWSCSKLIISAFLRGLYDGDGHSRTRDGEIGLTSTSYELLKQVRCLLLNMGIICNEQYHKSYERNFNLNGKNHKSRCRESWQLIIISGEAKKFYELIGFGLSRKTINKEQYRKQREFIPGAAELIQKFRNDLNLSISKIESFGAKSTILFGRNNRPTRSLSRKVIERFLERAKDYSDNQYYQQLKQRASPNIYWNKIESLHDGHSEVMDFTIPGDQSFWSNGFDSHNTNGMGGWYWSTWTDAEAGLNVFNPININWWDMDWAIEYFDPLSKEHRRIAPRDGIRQCTTKEDIMKYGPYWSPWLEEQYRALQEQGEAWKFKQEILASFIGSGNTILSEEALAFAQTMVEDPEVKVSGIQSYVHPVTAATEELDFSFSDQSEGLWVWEKPVLATMVKRRGTEIIEPGIPAHSYSMGVDISTGKGKDYCAIEIFDVDAREQVAEFMARVLPREFAKYVDRIGRWYNCALAVVERNNGGDIVIDMLRYDLMYPKLWRKKDINDKPQPQGSRGRRKQRAMKVAHYGFFTGGSSKPILNKYLINNLRDNPDEGYTVYSKRLLKQLYTYVRKRDRAGRDTDKTEAEEGVNNYDDLVIATGLALIGTGDSLIIEAGNLVPLGANTDFKSPQGPTILSDNSRSDLQGHYAGMGGPSLLMPMTMAPSDVTEIAAQRQLDAFTLQLGGIPINQGKPLISPPKYFFVKK